MGSMTATDLRRIRARLLGGSQRCEGKWRRNKFFDMWACLESPIEQLREVNKCRGITAR